MTRNNILDKIADDINKLKKVGDNKVYVGINDVFDILDKYRIEEPKHKRSSKTDNDDWSGAQGSNIDRIREEQNRAYWGIYG